MYTHQPRDSGVLFTDAPKTSSAKPTGEALSSLTLGMRRSLRNVARKLRDMDPQWKQYSMLCGASLVFLGIFATQELVSDRRRLAIFKSPLRKVADPGSHSAEDPGQEPEEPDRPRHMREPNEADYTSDSQGERLALARDLYAADQEKVRAYADYVDRYSSWERKTNAKNTEKAAKKKYAEFTKAANEWRGTWKFFLNQESDEPSAPEPQAPHRGGVPASTETNTPSIKAWAWFCLASVAAAPIVYTSIDSVQAAIMTGGWQAFILLPLLLLAPVLILGLLNGQELFTFTLTAGVLTLSAFGMLSVQKATALADTTSTFDDQFALDACRCVSLVLLFVAVWWFVFKSFNMFNELEFGKQKYPGVFGAILFAAGSTTLMVAQMGGDAVNSSSWNQVVSQIGVITLIVGLGIFGFAFAWQQKNGRGLMTVLAAGNAAALTFIAISACELLTTSPTPDQIFAHTEVMLICGFAVAVFALLCFFGRTNFGKKWRCSPKGLLGK